jgi:hypothetical protein
MALAGLLLALAVLPRCERRLSSPEMPMTDESILAERPLPTAETSGLVAPRSPSVPGRRIPTARLWGSTFAFVAVAVGACALLDQASLPIVAVAIVFLAVGLASLCGPAGAAPLVLALIPATLLANSGLVPEATYYVPPAILGLGVVAWTAGWALRRRQLPPVPSRSLAIFAILYLVGAAVATVFSIRFATSLPYVAAIGIVVLVSLWLGPWLLTRSDLGPSLLAMVALTGVTVTAISVLLIVTGPFLWFGRWVGAYLVHELTLNGEPTGLIVIRTSGPFLAPGGQALVLAPAILAMLALRRGLAGWARALAGLAIVVMVVALVSTFARVGWGAVIVGAAILAVGSIRSSGIDRASVLVFAVVSIAFIGLWVNAFGSDYRPDLTAARMGAVARAPVLTEGGGDALPAIPIPEAEGSGGEGGEPLRYVARGGSELSGRLEIWSASVRAILHSPWIGYGPGTNAPALDPFLEGDSRRFVGLSSHNTWLRTWVEDGIVGIIGFVGVALTALVLALRQIARDRRAGPLIQGMLAIFVGLGVAQAFETFLLGGVGLPSFVWAIAAGFLVLVPAVEPPTRASELDG